jgi:uncharacterized protein (DUF2236 family)
MTEYFVKKNSIVREIWGKSDTIIVIFAGASAEFALNKAVDWLYFTGRLPKDPLGRLFSTVSYARQIVFAEKTEAIKAINMITHIHKTVESKRGSEIPQWAYRDVLFMLIDYSIKAFEMLERPITLKEKQDVLDVFLRIGNGMGIEGLPDNFSAWQEMRQAHMRSNLNRSSLTDDLFHQYRVHLGRMRYTLLLQLQIAIVPQTVRNHLGFPKASFIKPLVPMYKLIRLFKADRVVKKLILPRQYEKEITAMDVQKKDGV